MCNAVIGFPPVSTRPPTHGQIKPVTNSTIGDDDDDDDDYPGHNEDNTKKKTWLAVGVAVGGTVVIAFLCVLSFWLHSLRKTATTSTSISCEKLEVPSVTDTSVSHVLQASDLSSVELVQRVKVGRFSQLWKATLNNNTVAVKIFSDRGRKSWNTEVNAYSYHHMKHDNLCLFISAENLSDGPIPGYWLVLEYHDLGSLQDYLKAANTLTLVELCKMAGSVASGLAHLHTEMIFTDGVKPAMAHRDVKSMNVLVKQDLSCCICDLGLSVTFEPGSSLLDAQAQVSN